MYPGEPITTNIQLLRSSVSHKRPTPSSLLDGQIAVNISEDSTSTGLFFKLTDGSLTKIGPVAVSPGTPPNAIPVGSSGNGTGEEWLDQRNAYDKPILKVYDGTNWMTSSGWSVDDGNGDFSLNRKITIVNLDAYGVGTQSYVRIPRDSLVSRGTIDAKNGMLRFNTDTKYFEGFDGDKWRDLASSGRNFDFENLTVSGNLDVLGDVNFGSGCSGMFVVDAYSNFKCSVDIKNALSVEGDSALLGASCVVGSGASDVFVVRSVSTFNTDATFQENVSVGDSGLDLFDCIASADFKNNVVMRKNLTVGSSPADQLRVNATTTLENSLTVKGTAEFLNEVYFNTNTNHRGDIVPEVDVTFNLGTASKRWANIYTGDLHLKNDRGDWTVIEEPDYLTLRQNETGKVFKILMEEIKD